jgi:protein-tyrosine-phosphatase
VSAPAPPTRPERLHVHFVCTGNAARSVMAAAMAKAWAPELLVSGSGTHSLDGRPISWRTREALQSLGLQAKDHLSAQMYDFTLDGTDLVVAMASEHVAYVRRKHPEAAPRTATLKRLVKLLPDLGAGPSGASAPSVWTERLASLQLDAIDLEPWEDVVDPAGGELDDFVACAEELSHLMRDFLTHFGGAAPSR